MFNLQFCKSLWPSTVPVGIAYPTSFIKKTIRITMITSIYASFSAILIVRLSLSVIKLRGKNRISVGDGGNEELLLAIRTHANAVEYIPIALLLLLTLELNGAPKILIHLLGATLIIGRIIHAMGLPAKNLQKRVLGMQITIYLLIALALLNILFLFFNESLKF
jgi:uncharacterized protein